MIQLELINRYILDPARLAQGRNDASSNGHFPVSQTMMGGTPRNFSLNAMPVGNGFMPGAPPMFNPAMGQYPMQMPPMMASHGAGPIRNARGPGGFDRNPRRSLSGRLSPPRGGVGRGRPNFMEGGVGTFGTSQAVEGRTMKSYNDLDAAGGGNAGNGALDY